MLGLGLGLGLFGGIAFYAMRRYVMLLDSDDNQILDSENNKIMVREG